MARHSPSAPRAPTDQLRSTERQRTGARAEQRACDFLERAGIVILTRNYRCRLGELDIVARAGAVLVIAEVRCRASDAFGGAAASITRRKQRRIVRATRHLLARHPPLQRLPVRFDALLVPCEEDAPIQWLRGAFDAG
ncbi:MAG: YraN family protein [Steroidobacteraceae bacterium]